ncbi:MAG: hypothetical protein BVN31_12180 [Proteobacteria bacterium ST_bin15]|nr:MAG: hypothetical protein BVN31_12180 [Proteobacteria bacterium ST_bin15]
MAKCLACVTWFWRVVPFAPFPSRRQSFPTSFPSTSAAAAGHLETGATRRAERRVGLTACLGPLLDPATAAPEATPLRVAVAAQALQVGPAGVFPLMAALFLVALAARVAAVMALTVSGSMALVVAAAVALMVSSPMYSLPLFPTAAEAAMAATAAAAAAAGSEWSFPAESTSAS